MWGDNARGDRRNRLLWPILWRSIWGSRWHEAFDRLTEMSCIAYGVRMNRRHFLNSSLCAGVSSVFVYDVLVNAGESVIDGGGGDYTLSLDVPAKLFDGKNFWCHPRAGIVRGGGENGLPRIVLTMTTMNVAGMDVYKNVVGMHTDDLGTWTEAAEVKSLAPRYESIGGEARPVAVADFWPCWHKKSKSLLGTGHTVAYTADWKVETPRPRHTSYAVYSASEGKWKPWKKLQMPAVSKFSDAGAGCCQRYDLEDGTILLPFYFSPDGSSSRVAVARCSFDGDTLRYIEHGNELSIDDNSRGLHEPSLTRFGGEYFLTIRNDKTSFVTRSGDGLHFEPYKRWLFDDDGDLGSYNTQQHWVTHSDGLYLVYTRRGADNDHVFRHRAPLFMAQVDPKRLRVIRATERILVPERGARMGNFGVTDVSEDETWVTVAEWMQPKGVEKYGSDGSIYVSRIHWSKPNGCF